MTSAVEQLDEISKTQASPDVNASAIAVRVRALVKTYKDGTQANRGIDLDVRCGETIAVLGPNGAGKTTFLRQLTTELRPTSGAIEVFDIDAVREPQRAKRMMGITPQEAGLFETLTVREHFELFARLKGLTKHESQAATREVIFDLELNESSDKRIGLLSGGQNRRVLIGLALLGKPPLLVLDEPTTGLDPASRHAVWRVLHRTVSEGATLILSTHYIEEAERLSDSIAIINAGRLVAFDSLEGLHGLVDRSHRLSFRDPLDPFGAPQVRLFTTFAEAQAYISRERLSDYTLARASLEDVYLTLTGERFEALEAEREA